MNELALFAGAGGGILGGHLLGWRCVCAVESDAYARDVLVARQNDGCLPPFPIWDDVCTFDGSAWRGRVDVVSGGFPCQDICGPGPGGGIAGERSGLWKEMWRIIREVRPRFVLVENSPVLTTRGLGVVLGDMAEVGYDARWGVLGADDAGLPHERERMWIIAHANEGLGAQRSWSQLQLGKPPDVTGFHENHSRDSADMWVEMARQFYRMDDGLAHQVDRTEVLGNGQVPAVVRLAWETLGEA